MSGCVLDPSVAVTALTAPGSPAADLLSRDDAVFPVPSSFDAEVLSALRGLVRGREFDGAAAAELIPDLMVLPVDRWHMSSGAPSAKSSTSPVWGHPEATFERFRRARHSAQEFGPDEAVDDLPSRVQVSLGTERGRSQAEAKFGHK